MITVFSKEKELNRNDSFIQTIYENLRRQIHYETSESECYTQKAIFNFYQTAYKIFNQLEKPRLDKSRNECLDLLTPVFSNFDVSFLIDFLRGESIQYYYCLKETIPAFELIKTISCYSRKFTPDFHLMREEYIKMEVFNIYQKINNTNQGIIPTQDFLVFWDVLFYHNTDSQDNELFNFYQDLLEKYADEDKKPVYDFIKRF